MLRPVRAEMAGLVEQIGQVTAECDRLHQRIFLLEKLLAGAPGARPPGAARAVAEFPSPAVAVILPTYNRALFVHEAIASVVAQSFGGWELVVVDDGGTDDTEAVVAPYLADRRIRYVRQSSASVAAARNRGIAETSAPLIAYIDSDNLWYPDFLSRAVDCFATEPEVDVVYGALATSSHGLDRRCILWTPFDRDALLAGNFIDTNVIVHRRSLVAQLGGWDAGIGRLVDWDLVLRYTAEKPARALNVLASYYRDCDDQRISHIAPYWPAVAAIRGKWFPPPAPARRPRVLYVVWQYPQLSETYDAAEISRMRAWGVHIEVWRSMPARSPYPTDVPIHDGAIADAISAARPDVIHIHWISFALMQQAALAASGLRVTLRMHGFDLTPGSLAAWLAHDWVAGVYAFPNQIASGGIADPRLKSMPVAFDTSLFKPSARKDRRMVLRTAASLPGKDLELFFHVARLFPEFRFVLLGSSTQGPVDYNIQLRALNETLGSPVDFRTDVPRAEVAPLMAEAGIYLHTMHRMGTNPAATPVGQPISIAEAMATGCYCLVRDEPALVQMVEGCGASYRDIDELAGLIRDTLGWSEAKWSEVARNAIERAYQHHADVTTLQPLFNDWMELSKLREEQ